MEQLKKCVKMELVQPASIWPYFGNLRITIRADDGSESCRNIDEKDLQLTLQIGLKN